MSWLFVSSAGGHLAQLVELRKMLTDPGDDVTWVTYPTRQAQTLLQGEQVIACHWPTTRNLPNAARNLRLARQVLDRVRPDVVVSTGAGVAVPFLSLAASRRISTHYVESATRAVGPSLSGRLLAQLPGVRVYTQHPSWADGRWAHRGSVFDGFDVQVSLDAPNDVRRVLVSLGTHPGYRFDRLVSHLQSIIPNHVEIVWQLGATPPPPGARNAHDLLGNEEMQAELARADVVIAHAGTGIALTSLEAGHVPILVPRDPRLGEHVDDHQRITGRWLGSKGLACLREVEELAWEDIAAAPATRPIRTSTRGFSLDLPMRPPAKPPILRPAGSTPSVSRVASGAPELIG